MIKAMQAKGAEAVEAVSQAYERIIQIGTTADGWILCESETGAMLLMEPVTHEVIPAY